MEYKFKLCHTEFLQNFEDGQPEILACLGLHFRGYILKGYSQAELSTLAHLTKALHTGNEKMPGHQESKQQKAVQFSPLTLINTFNSRNRFFQADSNCNFLMTTI